MRIILLCIFALAATTALLCAQETASIRTADGFQCPVGPNGTGEGYYVARGYRPNGHLGEDWNGIRGGDTDLGDPIYSIANGLVVFAKNYHVGWGNVVIIRHAYYEGFALKYVDSLYGHLLSFNVQEGDHVKRGQQIGRLGSNSGMYDAHLHFEIRKNLQIGMYRGSFPRDFSNYYSPSSFIAAHRICDRGNRVARTPINTFPATAPPSYAAGPQVYTPVYAPGTAPRNPAITSEPVLAPARSTPARVPDREPEPVVKTTLEPPPTPKPSPATPAPEKRVVVTKPTPTPASASVVKSTPKPKTVATTSTPAPKKTEEDAPATASSSKTTPKTKAVAASTPAPSKITAKSTKSTPSAAPKQTTSTAKTESTPAPKTASTSKSTTPKPTAKAATTSGPRTASSTKEPTKSAANTKPAPVAEEPPVTPTKNTTAAATFRSTVKPPPAPVAPAGIDPIEPPLPTNATPPITTPGSPIRRAGSGFRVDRFPDMRGNGY